LLEEGVQVANGVEENANVENVTGVGMVGAGMVGAEELIECHQVQFWLQWTQKEQFHELNGVEEYLQVDHWEMLGVEEDQ
jgi:hypothetical protein